MYSRTQKLSLVLALLAAGGLLVPTGAALFLPGQPTDDVGQQVSLQPTQSGYAYLEDDELVVDISPSNPNLQANGLNPSSVTTFEDVFMLHYGGDQFAEVWLTHEGEGIEFTTEGTSIETRTNNVTLRPNQSVAVGMTIDTADSAAIENIEEFTVHSRVPDKTETYSASLSASTVMSATVTVTTPAPGERLVTIEDAAAGESLEADLRALALEKGLTLDSMTVDHDAAGDSEFELATVEPNGTHPAVANFTDETGMAALGAVTVSATQDDPVERVEFRLSALEAYLEAHDVAGEDLAIYQYDGETWERMAIEHSGTENGSVLTVGTEEMNTLVVGAPTAIFDVAGTQVNRSEITAGETVTVTAGVTNRGTANGTATFPLSLDGIAVDQQTITLGTNATENLTFTRQLNQTGERILAIGSSAGVPVQVAAETNETAPDENTTETPTTTEPTEIPTTTETPVTSNETTTALVEEPASIGLDRIFGLGFAIMLSLMMVLLVRRRPLG